MDFDESGSRLLTQEFIAVVLAGFGNEYVWFLRAVHATQRCTPRLTPLTNNHGEEACPKALLPIANKPMLHYPLSWLEASGIRGQHKLLSIKLKVLISYRCPADLSCRAERAGNALHSIRRVYDCVSVLAH